MRTTDSRVPPTLKAAEFLSTGLFGATDVDLAIRLVGREPAALAEAFRRHACGVGATVRSVLGASVSVDDAVQEAFLELWRRPERFRPERGSLGTYLRTVARCRAIDRSRADDARRRRESAGGYDPGAGSVEDHVVSSTSAAQVHAALGSLAAAERRAIELAFFAGLSYRDVAGLLGQPVGTVKSRIRAGLRKLRSMLQGLDLSGPEQALELHESQPMLTAARNMVTPPSHASLSA